jgi:hypothetical protein
MKAGAPLSPALALYMEGVAGAQIDGITARGRRPRSTLSPTLELYMEGKVGVPLPMCRCFGSDRTPGVAPQGVFRSRMVSTTVAKWFVSDARGTVDNVYRFGPLRDE